MQRQVDGLWRQPEFIKLWTAQTISRFGSHIGGGALRFTAILILGATPFQLSLLTAAGMVPALLIGLMAGVWVDRLCRRPILIIADVGRAALLLSIPLAYMLDMLRIEQLYLVAGLVGVLTIWFDVAYHAFLPAVVRREHLIEGNSKLGMSDSVGEIAGPPLGGTLVQLLSAPLAILLDACSFVCSAVAIWAMRTTEPAPTPEAQYVGLRQELTSGLRAVRHDPVLWALLVSATLQNGAGGIIGVLYDVFLLRELGMSPAIVGLTVGVGGLGALAGAFLAEPLVERFGVGRTMVGSVLLSSAATLLLPLAHGPLGVSLSMILVVQASDVAGAVFFINALSLRQAITPDNLMGRVNATFGFATTSAGLVGALAGGLLGEALGLRAGIALGVVGVGLVSVGLAFSPVRRVRAVQQSEAAAGWSASA